jgi:hypothetical protein
MVSINQSIDVKAGDFFCYIKGEAINSCNIIEVREKAIKIDMATDSVWGSGKNAIVYTKTAWIPKSSLTIGKNDMLTIKQWLINKGIQAYPIKPYFEADNKKVFI